MILQRTMTDQAVDGQPDLTVSGSWSMEGDEGAKRAESENQQAFRIRLSSCLVIAVSVICLMIIDREPAPWIPYTPNWLPELLNRLVDGVIVFACAAFLAETRFFKVYLEQRLRKTEFQLLYADFISKAQTPKFLRQFDVKTLAQVEDCVRRATFAQDLPAELESFHKGLHSIRNRLSVWRTSYREFVAFEELPDHPGVWRVRADTDCVYLNYSAAREPLKFRQRFTEYAVPVEGVPNQDLYKLKKLEIGGRDYLPETPMTSEMKNAAVYFDAHCAFDLPPATGVDEGVRFSVSEECIRPSRRVWVQRFFYPVHGLDISCTFPAGSEPSLHVFGVGSKTERLDPLAPTHLYTNRTGGSAQWVYDGWLLPNHGFLITF